jgi:hypothetical protein
MTGFGRKADLRCNRSTPDVLVSLSKFPKPSAGSCFSQEMFRFCKLRNENNITAGHCTKRGLVFVSPDQQGSGRFHNSLNGPNTDSEFTGDLPNTLSCGSLALHCLLYGFRNLGSTQRLPLGLGTFQARPDPLLDHGALEFGKDAHHLEQGVTAWRRRIHPLLVQIQINALRMDVAMIPVLSGFIIVFLRVRYGGKSEI